MTPTQLFPELLQCMFDEDNGLQGYLKNVQRAVIYCLMYYVPFKYLFYTSLNLHLFFFVNLYMVIKGSSF